MKEIYVKCAYKHCQHESQMLPRTEAVKVGNRYFHKDCAETQDYIQKARNEYLERINSTEVVSVLVNVINTMVFKKNIPADYVWFTVHDCAENPRKSHIRHAQGLYYAINFEWVKKDYKKWYDTKLRREQMAEAAKAEEAATDKDGADFKYTAPQGVGHFSNIFGG